MRRFPSLLVVFVVGAALAGPASASTSTTKVTVKLKEFAILASSKAAPSGKITFRVTNIGRVNHEMVVMKTSLPPSKLPSTRTIAWSSPASSGRPETSIPGRRRR